MAAWACLAAAALALLGTAAPAPAYPLLGGWPYSPAAYPDLFDTPACTTGLTPPGCNGPNSPAGSAASCGAGKSCSTCSGGATLEQGLPVWWVSEPNIDLRLEDEPLGYLPGRGPRVAFRLSYQQRGTLPDDSTLFGVGPNWSCSFGAFVGPEGNSVFALHRGGAALILYTNGIAQPRDGSILTTNANGTFQIEYPDGSNDSFTNAVYSPTNGQTFYFLTTSSDPAGNSLTFAYLTTNGVFKLTSVTDADGNPTGLFYQNASFPNRITAIMDPFDRICWLYYDTNGFLTSVQDVEDNTNSVTYAASPAGGGWISALTTAYGTTSFRFGGVDSNNPTFFQGANQVNRFVEVTVPDTNTYGKHLCLYRQDSGNFITNSNYTLPSASLPNTLENVDQPNRNSFSWNPYQWSLLSAAYRTNGNTSALTNADYLLARRRHWLIDPATTNACSSLSLEQDPSPNSISAGQTTWYDYAGKPTGQTNYAGTNQLARFIARVMPDGSTWFQCFQRNSAHSQPTQTIEQWAVGGGTLSRTNSYTYATNAVDLLGATNALGITAAANIFNAFHQATSNYDALGQATRYTYDASRRLATVTAPSGLVTSNYYGTDGFLAWTADLGVRTNSYTWTNGLVAAHADERGLSTTNYWDNLQRPTATYFPDGSSLNNTYANLDLTRTIDRLSQNTYFGYDALRRTIAKTNAISSISSHLQLRQRGQPLEHQLSTFPRHHLPV